ncbi:MAG: hypothetical protein RR620_08370 [Clostridium sp.]
MKVKNFGELILNRRKTLKHTRCSIADTVGVTPTYLLDIERGRRPAPTENLLYNILDLLEFEEGTLEYFYALNLAAKSRDDIPSDVKSFIMDNADIIYPMLRNIKLGITYSDEEVRLAINKLKR